MDVFPGSTIAALCYTRDTAFDFHALASEMSKAVWDAEGTGRLDMPTPDFALCDTTGMRIGIARVEMRRIFPGSLTGQHYPSCMLLSVGPGETVPDAPMQARYARVRSELVGRIQDIAAADRVLMFERAGTYDAEVHDAVVDDIRGHLDKVLAPRRVPVSDAPLARPVAAQAQARAPSPMGGPVEPPAPPALAAPGEPGDGHDGDARAGTVPHPEDIIQGLASRVEAELARLERARMAFEQAEVASERRTRPTHGMRLIVPRLFPSLPPSTVGLFRMPGKPHPAAGAYPDYEHMPANVDERPLLHRAAVNALNVTVMTIALPVGAALLTMSVLGREDMLFSSRVTAVTGVGVGLYNTGIAERVFSLFS